MFHAAEVVCWLSQRWLLVASLVVVGGLQAGKALAADAPRVAPPTPASAGKAEASPDCGRATAGSIAAMVCQDPALSALDQRVNEVYRAALAKAGPRDRGAARRATVLKAEQRGWLRGRDDCWKSDDKPGCVRDAYQRRIAELQASYRLIPPTATARYRCEGDAPRVTATYFPTEPATLIAERAGEIAFMVIQPSASGARYQGRNESLWEHQGEAAIVWGYGAPETRCRKEPSEPSTSISDGSSSA